MKRVRSILAYVLLVCMLLSGCGPKADPDANNPDVQNPDPGANVPDPGPSEPDPGTPGQQLSTDIPAASEPSIQLHYKRDAGDYDQWGFWVWQQGGEGALYEINYQDGFGGVAVYPLSAFGPEALSKGIGIIPRRLDSWTKDMDGDRLLALSDLTMDDRNYYHIYMTQGDVKLYMDESLSVLPEITDAFFSSFQQLVVQTNEDISAVRVYVNGELAVEKAVENLKGGRVDLPGEVSFDSSYEVEVDFVSGTKARKGVALQKLYTTDAFNSLYNYDGELGALYARDATDFRVWSPVSERITLNIYAAGDGGSPVETVEMTKGEKGVFGAVLQGDYAGKYYTYTVYNYKYPDGREVVDPYAKSAGMSGERGMVVDFAATNPEGWDDVAPHPYDRRELTVWETHVADVTSSDTWTGTEQYRKRFLGMCESGTTYTENGVTVKTGFDHIVELGVNAVQLVPVFDQANNEGKQVFNWGYNPLNYNVLEGSYSTNPRDGYARIREFKQLVMALNGEGINVIMDVVYNHVSAAEGSNFDVLMPGYYFRYTDAGVLANGSACGNETASENPMFRKFMIDSVCFWAKEYKLGGFRFDLMGLHDTETMNLLVEALREINPAIVVYGEPWAGGTSPLDESLRAVQKNAPDFEGVGQFNDQIRDSLIKGGLNAAASKGWITNTASVDAKDVAKLVRGVAGVTFDGSKELAGPDKTVTYVTCHDNYTLSDRIRAVGITDEALVKKMAELANAVVLTSDGTAFLLAGEEFLRTKGGDSNSYSSSYEVNELDYALKIANADVFEHYKALIAYKQSLTGLLSEGTALAVEEQADGSVLRISFAGTDGRFYRVYHANGTASGVTRDLAGCELVYATVPVELGGETPIEPFQTLIVSSAEAFDEAKE